MSNLSPIVLVADDDDSFRTNIVDAFFFFGYRVEEARNGEELYRESARLIENENSFALTVDNQMPERLGEAETQWCGFECILNLCKQYPDRLLGKQVIFLSRWGLEDLPSDYRTDAERHGLLDDDHWMNVYSPFPSLKRRIEGVLGLGN